MGIAGSVVTLTGQTRSVKVDCHNQLPVSKDGAVTISSVSVEDEDPDLAIQGNGVSVVGGKEEVGPPEQFSQRASSVTFKSRTSSSSGTGFTKMPHSSVEKSSGKHAASEVERLRREVDMLRNGRDKQVLELRGQNVNLSSENSRLRNELKMQQNIAAKLRLERNAATDAEEHAFQRAKSFEEERDRLQNVFKKYREAKEKEVTSLHKRNHDMERKLRKMLQRRPEDAFSDPSNPGQEWLPLQAAVDVKGPTNVSKGDWSAATATLAQKCVQTVSHTQHFAVRVYVAGTNDMTAEVNAFLELCSPLQRWCESEACHLTVVHVPFSEMVPTPTDSSSTERLGVLQMEPLSTLIRKEIERSDLFVAFIAHDIHRMSREECERGHLNNPGARPAIFCFDALPASNSQQRPRTFKAQLRAASGGSLGSSSAENLKLRIQTTGKARVFTGVSTNERVSAVFAELERLVKLELSSGRELSSNSSLPISLAAVEERLEHGSAVSHYHDDSQQEQLLRLYSSLPAMPVLDKYMNRLDEHVTSAGPLPPLLVMGDSGCGKTTLLAHWVNRQLDSHAPHMLLYHFLTAPTSVTADAVTITHRFVRKFLQSLGLPLGGICGFGHGETFSRLLDKVSSLHTNGLVIVLDGVDHIECLFEQLSWLMDPLPVETRVIVSCSEDRCPEKWKSWPTLLMTPLNSRETKTLLRLYLGPTHNLLVPDQESSLSLPSRLKSSNSLYTSLVSRHLASDSNPSALPARINACLACQDVGSLVEHILTQLEEGYQQKDLLIQVLVAVCLTRDGIVEADLLELCSMTWSVWLSLRQMLVHHMLVAECCGLLMCLSLSIVSAVRAKYYDGILDQSVRSDWTALLLKRFRAGFRSSYLMNELPYQLQKLGMVEDLRQVLLSVDSFLYIYTRGRSRSVVLAWHFLGESVDTISDSYVAMARQLQYEADEDETRLYLVSILCENLGRFMKEVNKPAQGAELLQRALEIREELLDPDHISVSRALHHLASIHTAWNKPQTAQSLLHKAMDITRDAVGAVSMQMADHLDALAAAVTQEQKHDEAEQLHQQATHIRQKAQRQPIYQAISSSPGLSMLSRNGVRVTLDDATMLAAEPSAEHARSLNELGVLCFLQGDQQAAEKCFIRALEMRDQLLGGDNADVAQSLNNLAALYNDLERYNEAEPLYLRALTVRKKVFDETHPSVATSVNQLAALYRKQGKYCQALPLYRQAVEIREKSFGPVHPSVATALNNLAVVYCQLNDHQMAAPLYQRALHIYEKVLGRNHPRVSETLRNLAVLKYDMGMYDEAAVLYKRATDISEADVIGNGSESSASPHSDVFNI